jgi:hypothetical protein
VLEGITTQIEKTKRRKTIGFEVIPGSIVRILVPEAVTESYLEKVIRDKATWIYQKVEEANKILINQRDREFVAGESFPFQGKEYRLRIAKNLNAPTCISDGHLLVSVPKNIDKEDQEDIIKARIISFYKSQALVKLQEVVDRFSSKLGLRPNSFDIRDYKSSWGMCTKNGEVFINWRVIMAPISVINYVVVHELCHLVHPNHSREFWSLVSSQVSDVQACKDWLKYNQKAISI